MCKRAICFLLVTGFLSGASATTIHIPADQPTIQAGINNASPGDTVLVSSGTYVENLNFNQKEIALVGQAGASATILRPATPSQATILISGVPWPGPVLRGFTVENGGSTYTVRVENCAALITENVFRNNIPVGSINVEVITCTEAEVTVLRNLFYGNGGIGCVGLRSGSASSKIINNTFDGNERGFFSIAGGGTALNNIVSHSLSYGVAATDPTQWSLLDYNDVWSNGVNYMTGVAGVHDLSADPLYADAGNHIYTLQMGSPCIDAGHPGAQYNDPDESPNDIGAYPVNKSLPLASQLAINGGASCFATPNPVISWVFVDTGLTQTAYQIQVGTDDDWTTAEMWDPGETFGSETMVVYGGTTLGNGQSYYLRARVQDVSGWGDWTHFSFTYKTGGLLHVPGDYATIQNAIDAAATCDTIVVDPGNYAVNLSIMNKSVSLRSSGGPAVTTLTPSSPGSAVLQISNALSDQISIHGFTITGGGATHTIVINNASPLLDANVFHDNIPFGSNNVEVISCNNASATITHNLFYNNGGIGCVGLRTGSQGTKIINNTFDGNERGFFSIAIGGIALNNIVTHSQTYGVAANSPGNFSLLDYNDVWANGVDYMTGVNGVHDISADPLYLDLGSRQYGLLPMSPCVDAGSPDPLYNDPDGSRNDMGAFSTVTTYPLAAFLVINGNDPCMITPTPTIAWTFVDTGGLQQSAYQIQVGTDNDWTTAEVWDPGVVFDAATSVVLGGAALSNGQLYYVRVRVQDITGFSEWQQATFLYRTSALIYVPTNYASLQAAIDAAQPCDTIVVAPGEYSVNLQVFAKELQLRSSDGPQTTILQPQNPLIPIIELMNTNSSPDIRGFTFTGVSQCPAMRCTNSVPRISNNIFHHNIPVGTMNTEVVSLIGTSALIDHNVFYANGGIGCIGLREGSSGTRIINNTFDNNERGFYSIAGGGTALNNIVSRSLTYGVAATSPDQWSLLDYNNVWGNSINYMTGVAGVHDLSEDPAYRKPHTFDFTLKPGSPCIDRGDPDPMYDDSNGTRNDIGALQFTAHAPTAATLIFPPSLSNSPVYDMMPQFSWNQSTDVDPDDTVHYELQVSLTSGFSLVYSRDSIVTNFTKLADSLQFGTHYWWRVVSTDLTGLTAISPINDFWTWELGDLDKSHNTDIADLALLIDHLYLSFIAITPPRLADLDGDCRIDISDLSALIDRLYISFTPLKAGC